ncbi:hypothetical protein GCM10010178_72320 [Lentzea flava]|uniref:Lasso RiPP family leader peptide-containing protein n=1 Tax=Lentzea flava TaxID=103732 RepID=A0ABQ2V867_9PSEU|nr:hypothetical protein GCM10010178_72320 [Lentzea flava]
MPGPVLGPLVTFGRRALNRQHRRGEVRTMYETPQLIDLGTFEAQTGLLGNAGNDRLILSKN